MHKVFLINGSVKSLTDDWESEVVKCFECGSEVVAVCRYCGRAVCRVHAKEGPVLNEVVASYGAGATRE